MTKRFGLQKIRFALSIDRIYYDYGFGINMRYKASSLKELIFTIQLWDRKLFLLAYKHSKE